MRMNFTKNQLEGQYLPDTGTFVVKIAAMEKKVSKAGNDMMSITVRGTGEYAGKKAFIMVPMTAATQFRWVPIFKAAGYAPDDLVNGVETDELLGKTVGINRSIASTSSGEGGKTHTNYNYTWFRPTQEELELASQDEDLPF